MRLAYLTSRYPAVSHTFIRREIAGLRALGVDVHAFSIRRAEAADALAPADRKELGRTHALLPTTARRLLVAHVSALVASPSAYFRTLGVAVELAPGGLRKILWQLFYFAESMLLWHECRTRGLRHVHVHFANVAADVALLCTRFGSAVDPDGHEWSWSLTMHGPTELYDVAAHRLPQKAADARFVICISEFARSQLMAILDETEWDKLHVVHCGVPVAELARRPGDPAPTGGPTRVLCVGRLVPVKGQLLLVRALAQLAGDGSAWSLDLVGEGPSRPAIEAEVARLDGLVAVKLWGALGEDEMRARYLDADIFCLPSFGEGLPVVLMEAMAMGVPVVTTRIAGIPELVRDGESGLLIAPGSQDELVAALRRVAADESMRARLAEAGGVVVGAEFEAAATTRQLRDVLAGYLDSSG